jgi:dihydrofolate synthase/folylpolyglutamate synthase
LDASADAIHAGLRDVRRRAGFRGRCDVLQTEPLVIADAAHNPSSLAAALELIRPALARRGGRLHVGFGGIRDKDLAGMGRLLRQAGAVVYPVRFDSPRSMPPDETGAVLKGEDVDVHASGTVPAIMDRFRDAARPEDGLLLAGSHAVVAEVPALRPLFDGGPA